MSRNIAYENYVKDIQDILKEYGYSSHEIDNYMSKTEIKDYVMGEYKYYVTEDPEDITSGGHSPNAVAYCLDLLY